MHLRSGLGLLLSAALSMSAPPEEHRGLWMEPLLWQGPDSCVHYAALFDTANLNVVYPMVTWKGRGCYPSEFLVPAAPGGFDVLNCLLDQFDGLADVHPWFSIGPMPPPDSTSSNWLASHWELGIQDASGWHLPWMDPGCGEARQWLLEVILEACGSYGLDGVHLDYVRYPCSGMGCWCDECLAAYEEAYGPSDLPPPDRCAFPTFARFRVHGVASATAAQVLAEMTNGPGSWPAVMLNSRGEGDCLLLNWNSHRGAVGLFGGAMHSVLSLALDSLAGGDIVGVLDHNADLTQSLGSRLEWMGYDWWPVAPDSVEGMAQQGVLICPGLEWPDAGLVADIDSWVCGGGGVVFLGGPGGSMQNPQLAQLVGGQGEVSLNDVLLIEPAAPHPWIFTEPPLEISVGEAQAEVDRWDDLQAGMLSDFVQEVSDTLHSRWPGLWVNAAVFYMQGPAEGFLQRWWEWPAGRPDYVMPMAYVSDSMLMAEALAWYDSLGLLETVQCAPGLGPTHTGASAPEVVEQIDMTRDAGAGGQVIYCEDFLTTESAAWLRDNAYGEPVAPAYPEQAGTDPDPEEDTEASVWCSPNPAPGTAYVSWRVPGPGCRLLQVFDISGRLVRTLVDGNGDGLRGVAAWNGRTTSGRKAPPGVYMVRLATPQEVAAGRLVLLGD